MNPAAGRRAVAADLSGDYRRAVRDHEQGFMGDGGLEAVLLNNRPALLRFLHARGGPADAEDLIQELWLKLSTAPPAGPIADPLAYLYRAADNMMHDRRRAAMRRQCRDAAWVEVISEAKTGASDAPSPERVLVARDELAAAERTLAALGERTERIFRRFRFDGASQKAIAAEQGISLSAVEKHLQRAYRAIMALRAGEREAGSGAAPAGPQRRRDEDKNDAAG